MKIRVSTLLAGLNAMLSDGKLTEDSEVVINGEPLYDGRVEEGKFELRSERYFDELLAKLRERATVSKIREKYCVRRLERVD